MKKWLILAGLVLGTFSVTADAKAQGFGNYRPYYGATNSQFNFNYNGWGHSGGFYQYGPIRYHDTSHYDYFPPTYYPHGNHYHYIPGHYDYHQTGYWSRW